MCAAHGVSVAPATSGDEAAHDRGDEGHDDAEELDARVARVLEILDQDGRDDRGEAAQDRRHAVEVVDAARVVQPRLRQRLHQLAEAPRR